MSLPFRSRLIGAAVLTLVAAIPRFHDLGGLSLYTDEGLTVLSARSVVESGDARLPSGMAYYRALPFTWLNAGAARLLGVERDGSYRVVAAAFGAATPAALFLTGMAFVPPSTAFVAGAALALSEWHIAMSRFARMYAPFLFFFVLTAFFFWTWARDGGRARLVLALGLFMCTMSQHLLGVFAIQFAAIPLVLRGRVRPSPLAVLVAAAGATVVGLAVDRFIVQAPYQAWRLPAGFQLEGFVPRPAVVSYGGALVTMLGLVGAVVGAWLGWTLRGRGEPDRAVSPPLFRAAMVGAGLVFGAFLGMGHLWGAGLAAVVLLALHPGAPGAGLGPSRWPLGILALGAPAWLGYAVLTLGPHDGLRRLLTYPVLYPLVFWSAFPGLTLLFAAAAAWVVLLPLREDRAGLVGATLAVLLTLAAIGLERRGAARYVFHAYPYLLLVATALLVHLVRRAAGPLPRVRPDRVAAGVALVLVLSGALGGHGVAAAVRTATLEHGTPVNPEAHIFPSRPDHRGPGRYVRTHRVDGDVVIAEHPAIQFIYAGPVDYWLRRPGDARHALYLGQDGRPRERYVGAVLLPTVARVEEAVRLARGRAWLITSGETARQREWFLSRGQEAWLDSVETNVVPAFAGEDGATRVYCLNCAGKERP